MYHHALRDDIPELGDLLAQLGTRLSESRVRNMVNKNRTQINRHLDDVWNHAHLKPLTPEKRSFLIAAHKRLVRKRKQYDEFLDRDFMQLISVEEDDPLGVTMLPMTDTTTLTVVVDEDEEVIWGPNQSEGPPKLPSISMTGTESPMAASIASLTSMGISPVPSRTSTTSPSLQRPITPFNLPGTAHHQQKHEHHHRQQQRQHQHQHQQQHSFAQQGAGYQQPHQLMPKLVMSAHELSRAVTPTMMAGAPMTPMAGGRPSSPMRPTTPMAGQAGQASQPIHLHPHQHMHPIHAHAHPIHHGRMMHGMAGAPVHPNMMPVQRRKMLLRADGKSPEQRDHFKVFVGGFARGTTSEQFREALGKLGITPAPGKINIMVQQPHRHGFVQCLQLRSIQDADKLISLSPLTIDCQRNPLEIKPYLSRRQYRRANQNLKQQKARQRAQAHAYSQAFVRQASG